MQNLNLCYLTKFFFNLKINKELVLKKTKKKQNNLIARFS